MPQRRGKNKSQAQAPKPVEVENADGAADQSFKCGLKHTGTEVLAPGTMIMTEKPVLSILQKSAVPTVEDLQQWANKFAALDANTRDRVLDLDCHDRAAAGGALAALVGPCGEHLRKVLSVPAEVGAEQVWELLRILECNTIDVSMKGGGSLSMLLLMGSHLKHSCLPNALIGLGEKPGTVEVRALRAISPGDEVTVSYVSEEVLLSPTAERRASLHKRWQFVCACDRCSQPDASRLFKCSKLTCKEGRMCVSAAGDSMEACNICGKALNPQTTAEFLVEENKVTSQAPGLLKDLQKAAARLSLANQQRDGEAYTSASEIALTVLGKAGSVAQQNKKVDPGHQALVGVAKSCASVRTMLGDSFGATGRAELAQKLWVPAAGELKEAMDAQHKALPGLPRDGRVVDLVGLGALYNRLDKPEEARACFEEAQTLMGLVSWACAPARREELETMRQGIEAALADAK